MFLVDLTKVISQWIHKGIKRKRFISKHFPLSIEQMDDKVWEQLKEDIDEELEESYANYDFLSFEQQNLIHRLSQMRRRVSEKKINDTDIKLIHYLYGKEELDNISYNVTGSVKFSLKEPYFSFLKIRTTQHFFMKYYLVMNETHALTIKGWQRKKEELLDLLLFIARYGTITELSLAFPKEEYGFERIEVENGKLIAIHQHQHKKEIEKTNESFLMNLAIPENETRKLRLKPDITIPLMKEFMRPEYDSEYERYKEKEKNVQLENGTQVTACSQCVFRIRQLSGGCKECKPAVLKKEK